MEQTRSNPKGIAFHDVAKVCTHYFGEQNDKGMAKAYQVRQALKAIDKKEGL